METTVKLTTEEKRWVRMLANNFTVPEIAAKLEVNNRTLETKIFYLRKKCSCETLAGLVAMCLRQGIIK